MKSKNLSEKILRSVKSNGFKLKFPTLTYLNKEIKKNSKKTINHIFKKY